MYTKTQKRVAFSINVCYNIHIKTHIRVNNKEENTMKTNYLKSFLTKMFCTLLILTISLSISSCSTIEKQKQPKTKENLDYNDVIDFCCEAINKKDKSVISDFIYNDFGEDWNKENIYDTIENFEKEDLPLENKIRGYDTHESTSDLQELQDWIFEETNRIVTIDKGLEIGMDNDSHIEIFLVMIDENWYILYLDL